MPTLTIAPCPAAGRRSGATGELAEPTILYPPTFKALSEELDRAEKGGKPDHVVHFDGHGVFDRSRRDGPGGRQGLGRLWSSSIPRT